MFTGLETFLIAVVMVELVLIIWLLFYTKFLHNQYTSTIEKFAAVTELDKELKQTINNISENELVKDGNLEKALDSLVPLVKNREIEFKSDHFPTYNKKGKPLS